MANIRTLKRRIKTAKNIAQTTKAMELVAASRMKKAQDQALNNKPYANILVQMVESLLGRINLKKESYLEKYFKGTAKAAKILLICLTQDKGLSGALISNFIRYLNKIINDEQKKISECDFIIFGKKGKEEVLKMGGNIIAFFETGMTGPKYENIGPVVKIFQDAYLKNLYQKIFLVYTDFINTLNQKPKSIKLLPLSKKLPLTSQTEVSAKLFSKEYLFEPNEEQVLKDLLPHYFEQEVYHGLLESYASEQSARMTAMKNATDNANEIIAELTLYYNKARQQVITSEISDIITATLSLAD